jgi:LysR family glycine cleavage system transcriptional activator
MLPSIESLRYFAAAAKLLNFRAASRSVALTPTAFGQRIRQLEDQLGVALFERTTRSVRLTEAGLALLPRAEACVALATECTQVGSGKMRPPPIDIVLGTRHELGISWLLPQIDALSGARGESAQIHLYFGSGNDLVLRVRTLEIDCAVTSSRVSDPKLESIRLHREDYVFVGAASLLKKTPLTRPEHAHDHTLIDIDADLPLFRYWRDSPKGGDRLRFGHVVRLGTIEAIHERVRKGKGVAVLPAYLVRSDLARRSLKSIFPNVSPSSDWFRLVFRADDPRRRLYDRIAAHLLSIPLR